MGIIIINKEKFVLNENDMTLMQSIALGGVSSGTAAYLTNGLDMSKLRMQVERAEKATGSEKNFEYRNVFHGISSIVRKEGVLALFRGSLTRSLYYIPSSAINIGLLEYIRHSILKNSPY